MNTILAVIVLASSQETKPTVLTRTASVYSASLDGRPMAAQRRDGKGPVVYDHDKVSFASNDLPLWTKVALSYKGRSVTGYVLDRMAKRFSGKRIDTSGKAYSILSGGKSPGLLKGVKVTVVK